MALPALVDEKGQPVVISRRDAADSGRTFFFTGVPCKHGHRTLRYVTSGGCLACMTHHFKPRINPWTNKLIPFSNSHLWTGADLSKEERLALRVYLQHCIFEFLRKMREGHDLAYRSELEAAMLEIEERGRHANVQDPRNTD